MRRFDTVSSAFMKERSFTVCNKMKVNVPLPALFSPFNVVLKGTPWDSCTSMTETQTDGLILLTDQVLWLCTDWAWLTLSSLSCYVSTAITTHTNATFLFLLRFFSSIGKRCTASSNKKIIISLIILAQIYQNLCLRALLLGRIWQNHSHQHFKD